MGPMWYICLLWFICNWMDPAGGVLCPNGCKCENEILRANCSGAGIEVVPIQLNPELHVMDLSRNKITQLHYFFTFYEKLFMLDVSKNRVENIGSGYFKTQKVLKALNLSCNSIGSLNRGAFEGLGQLVELDLSNNAIETIAASAFADLTNLTSLNMNGNQLDYFEEGTFKNTPNLMSLYLDDNLFIELPTALIELRQLKVLTMARNLIETIDSVPNLPELQTLVLVQNLIQDIESKGFSNTPNLDHLDLSDNNLTSVPTALSKLFKLINLKLSGNHFNTLPPVTFRGLFHLKFLTLNRLEQLETIDARAFVDNINLEKISLDYNYKTKSIPTRLFHGNPKLRYISIKFNSIKFMVVTHFPLDQLNELKVGGNPLECNCSMGWLWKLLHDSNSTKELQLDVSEIVCETPEELHNHRLVTASQRQMDCSMSWIAILSVLLTIVFILSIIIGVLFFLPKKKSNQNLNKDLPKIIKTNYNAPPLPPPRKSHTPDNNAERYIMPPILLQNRSMPAWDTYQQQNYNGNIYEQLNDQRDRPHIVYV